MEKNNVSWLKEDEQVINNIPAPADPDQLEQWQETPGDGKILVKKRGYAKGKYKKQITLSQELKSRLDDKIIGSQVVAINVLLDYALDQLEKNQKNLEV